ncbi:hypothetical protein L2E82_44311 [Cichorium intybus]|uniref:Uncharacterized protein n=1 Tax=Cichorium intybus TaxID=13427 RepID=A0ACB8ZQZ2_CICIN|nr:hypothetical protein L2E82_44311 [Cichorium intybus]
MHPLVVDASTSLAELEIVDNDSDNSDYDDTIWDWMEADEDETNNCAVSTTDRDVELDCDGEGDYREATATKVPPQEITRADSSPITSRQNGKPELVDHHRPEKTIEKSDAQIGVPGQGQILFSRLTGLPTSRTQINGH